MTQAQVIVVVAIVALCAVALLLALRSWRRRVRRQAIYGAPAIPPTGAAAPFVTLEGQYLATTAAGNPLERIAIDPLGFRAKAAVLIGSHGVEVQLDGASPVFIPAADVIDADRATWNVDRGVETAGLNRISWLLNGHPVESTFRMHDPEGFDAALHRLLTERTTA